MVGLSVLFMIFFNIYASVSSCPELRTTVHIQNYDGPIILHSAASCENTPSTNYYQQCEDQPRLTNYYNKCEDTQPRLTNCYNQCENDCTCTCGSKSTYPSTTNIGGYIGSQPSTAAVPTYYGPNVGLYDQLPKYSKQYETDCSCVTKQVSAPYSQVSYYPINGQYCQVDDSNFIGFPAVDAYDNCNRRGCQCSRSGSYC